MTVATPHRVRAADGVEIVIHRLTDGGGVPVVLVAGTFSSRMFWLGSAGQGLAYALAEAGFDPWIAEPRGHGASDRPKSWTMEDWVRFDAPAAVNAIRELSGSDKLFWIGHSAGGVVGAAFAGSGDPATQAIGGMVLLGAPGPATLAGVRRWGARGLMVGARAMPGIHWPGRPVRLGPEREPSRLIAHWMGWNLSGRWHSTAGNDYLSGLANATMPVLAVAGAGDRYLSPPHAVQDLLSRFGSLDATLLVAGRDQGFSLDYDHAGLVLGRPARDEVWPRIIEWLQRRAV